MFMEINDEPTAFGIWGVTALILAIPLRRFVYGLELSRGKDKWESPEKIRSEVVNSPQFVGRFDRDNGLLEATATMVEQDVSSLQTMWMAQPKTLNVTRFRGEILRQDGSPLEYIPVEIKGSQDKWVGSIHNGDRIRVEGKVEEDGILHANNAFNYSTNSWVGERK
jgi:hypothetical protein